MFPRIHTIGHAVFILGLILAVSLSDWPEFLKLLYAAVIAILAERMEVADANYYKAKRELEALLGREEAARQLGRARHE